MLMPSNEPKMKSSRNHEGVKLWISLATHPAWYCHSCTVALSQPGIPCPSDKTRPCDPEQPSDSADCTHRMWRRHSCCDNDCGTDATPSPCSWHRDWHPQCPHCWPWARSGVTYALQPDLYAVAHTHPPTNSSPPWHRLAASSALVPGMHSPQCHADRFQDRVIY